METSNSHSSRYLPSRFPTLYPLYLCPLPSHSRKYLWHTLQQSYLPLSLKDGGLGGDWSRAFGQILGELVAVERDDGWSKGLGLLQASGA